MARRTRPRYRAIRTPKKSNNIKKVLTILVVLVILYFVVPRFWGEFASDKQKRALLADTTSQPQWSMNDRRDLESVTDDLIDVETIELPYYLRKGDRLFFNFISEEAVNISFWNYDKETKISDYGKTNSVIDVIEIPVSAIYYFSFKNDSKQYCSYTISKSSMTKEDFDVSAKVDRAVQDDASPKDPRAVKFDVLEPTSLFLEPKQITLKKLFSLSGSTRSLIPVSIPKGVSDFICRIRVSSSRMQEEEDGQLHNDINSSISRFIDNFSIRRQTARMIFDELNRPHTKKDCTIDLYVFNSEKWSRLFQTAVGDDRWEKNYDVSNSIIGTQSCNHLISVKGKNMIYLGFVGTHSFADTYLWLECEFLKPTTKYSKIVYSRY